MKVIVGFVLSFILLQGEIYTTAGNTVFNECLPGVGRTAEVVAEYSALEIVNNFQRDSLKNILSHKGVMPEDNAHYNQYILCVWKNEGLIIGNEDINYPILENFVTHAIVSAVGATGPAINLSMYQAGKIVNECKKIKGLTPGQKVAKVQNHIVTKLQPFTKI